MAWRLTGDKPLSEPMIAYFSDTYASLDLNELKQTCFWTVLFVDISYTYGNQWVKLLTVTHRAGMQPEAS